MLNWYLLGKKTSHAHKATRSWYLIRVLVKITHEHPRRFYMRVPRGVPRGLVDKQNVTRQGHDNKPVQSAGSCVDLDQ